MNKNDVLSKRFNNALTLGLGLPTLAFAVLALSIPLMSEFAAFLTMAGIGSVY